MAADFGAYLDHLDRLGKTLEELTQLTREKTRAVVRGDLQAVDAAVRREQALSLSLRGAEQRRERLLADLGLQDTALSGLAERAPEQLRTRAARTAEALRRQYELYRDTAEVARTTLECNLHMLEKHMKEVPGASAPGASITDIRA